MERKNGIEDRIKRVIYKKILFQDTVEGLKTLKHSDEKGITNDVFKRGLDDLRLKPLVDKVLNRLIKEKIIKRNFGFYIYHDENSKRRMIKELMDSGEILKIF